MKLKHGARVRSMAVALIVGSTVVVPLAGEGALAGDCPCSADIGGGAAGCKPSGNFSLEDVLAMIQCLQGDTLCGPDQLNCDINCDGVFNLLDASIFFCMVDNDGIPGDCCTNPDVGACCLPVGACESASEFVCSIVLPQDAGIFPTLFAPGVTCDEGPCPVAGPAIPAVSEWGLLILTLGVLNVGALLLRRRWCECEFGRRAE